MFDLLAAIGRAARGNRTRPIDSDVKKDLCAFHLRVRLAGGKVAPPRPWFGDGAKWATSAIWAHSASRHMEIEIGNFTLGDAQLFFRADAQLFFRADVKNSTMLILTPTSKT